MEDPGHFTHLCSLVAVFILCHHMNWTLCTLYSNEQFVASPEVQLEYIETCIQNKNVKQK